jgi:mono/diheme cytochrome c family protein
VIRWLLTAVACTFLLLRVVETHGTGAVTWNREISRVVFDKCGSCHRPDGTAFSLMTYADAQPRANEIKEAVLARRMPPWGGVKGFGQFRNDSSLSQEQVELITKWVDGGIRRGNNPDMLPKAPEFQPAAAAAPEIAVRVSGRWVVDRPFTLDGLIPEKLASGQSFQIVARLPGGKVEPLLWLHAYDSRFSHPFLLRRPLQLTAGAVIDGVPPDAVVALIRH